MSVISSIVLGLNGAVYVVMGGCMLYPGDIGVSLLRPYVSSLYASVFKPMCVEDSETGGVVTARRFEELRVELSYRILAYLIVVMGACRFLLCFFWGCGYVYVGLWTCIAEAALVCNELLLMESVNLHRGMLVLVCNAILGIVFVCLAVPHCS